MAAGQASNAEEASGDADEQNDDVDSDVDKCSLHCLSPFARTLRYIINDISGLLFMCDFGWREQAVDFVIVVRGVREVVRDDVRVTFEAREGQPIGSGPGLMPHGPAAIAYPRAPLLIALTFVAHFLFSTLRRASS